MQKWVDEASAYLGIVLMILLAGTAAYIKAYEKAGVEWPRSRHLGVWVMKMIYAAFSGFLVWYAAQAAINYGMAIPYPLIPMIIGIAGFSGAQFLDFLSVTLMDWGRTRLGLRARENEK